jgi:hypothetical protein
MADVVYTPRRTTWDPTYNGNKLGTSLEIDLALKLMLSPITRGTTGKLVLGQWVDGLTGSIKMQLPDVSPTLLTNLSDYATGSPTATPLHPTAIGVNLYDVAKVLTLHPHDMGTDLTQDLHFPHAANTIPVNCFKRDGAKDDVYAVEFFVFADLAELFATPPKIVFGYMGATAP